MNIVRGYCSSPQFFRLMLEHVGIALLALPMGMMTFALWPGRKLPASGPIGSRLFLTMLVGLAFVACVGVALLILQNFSNSADEYSCLFLAKCFLAKKLYATTDALQEFFHFTHIGEKDGKWFSVYPPGWPLLLAIGMAAKIPWIVNPLLATLTLVLIYKIALKVADARVALLACLWIGSSSFFLLHAGSYYSHMCCLFLLSAFAWCFILAVQEARGPGWFFLAGLLLGYAMMTRYLSALAFGAPFGIYLLYRIAVTRNIKARDFLAFALGLAVFNLFQLWFQYRVTGNAFLTPIHYYYEHERLGFRRDFPPQLGLDYTAYRMFWYAEWVVPGFWVFAVLAFFVPRKNVWDKVLLWSAFLCCSAYTLYYSFGGNQFGPRYLFESIVPLGIVGAKTFFAIWDRIKDSRWQPVLGAGLALGFMVNAFNVAGQMSLYRQITAERKSLYTAVENAGLTNSVVFIRDWMGHTLSMAPTDLTRNSPNRDDAVLYVVDLGVKNKILMDAMPQRSFYTGVYDSNTGTARLIAVDKQSLKS